MQEALLPFLRCPVTGSSLRLQVISKTVKQFHTGPQEILSEGILWAGLDWFYPIIGGIPRLLVESFEDHADFLAKYIPDFYARRQVLYDKYGPLIRQVIRKNKRTKKSFHQEWSLYNYAGDKTWNADKEGMMQRFLQETDETLLSIRGKLIFDAGCGNGLLNSLLAGAGTTVIGMDFSRSIEQAFAHNLEPRAHFIQGDVRYPPVKERIFDIVQCSGVLIHTPNTREAFYCIEPCVKSGGKLSVWLYHPRKDLIHNTINQIRRLTSRLPMRLQYYLYRLTLLPVSFVIKRLKGNKQNLREMMIDILDWFSPEYRWEHEHQEVEGWFERGNYISVKTTTNELFGFNMTGVKK